MDNRCVKCGEYIGDKKIGQNKKLWCGHCSKELDNDFKIGHLKPFDYYFRFYQKHKGKTK